MSTFDPQPTTLRGNAAKLVPLEHSHADDLAVAGQDARIWSYLACVPVNHPDAARQFIDDALRGADRDGDVPFAIIDQATGRAVGSTRYLNVRRPHRSLEIGWTWLGADSWRTAINTECKLLLMTHAFEVQQAVRVEFKTDARNERSQAALLRIGASLEGTLRQHMLMPDGYRRDSVYFSVLDQEWPQVKQALEAKRDRR